MSLPSPSTSLSPSSSGGARIPDPRDYAEFEGPLIELAQRSGGDLRKLLTAFFGFLHRRTDFYCIVTPEVGSSNPKMGFKEGDAEKLLLAAFRQFPLRKISAPTPPVVTAGGAPSALDQPTETNDSSSTVAVAPAKITKQPVATPSAIRITKETPPVMRLTEEGKQIPVGNGGSTDRYTWTQTLEECSVLLGGIPEGVRAKDLEVELKPTTLSVRSKTPLLDDSMDPTQPRTFLQGTLSHRIVPSESTWTLESGVLVVVLYKQQKLFWERILEGDDPPIDTTLVDSRRHIQSYDEATQAQIRKIMFDEQQKAEGKPTSDELSGARPVIPPLPPGVEYINQEILDEKTREMSVSKKT